MSLDTWTITDADDRWDFRVEVTQDEDGTRPEKDSDVYDADAMLKMGNDDPNTTTAEAESMAQWAREAVKAWENDLWTFATVEVTPVLKSSGVEFVNSRFSVGHCDYGWLPGSEGGEGVWTDGREYVRTAWANDLIEEAREDADKTLHKIKEEK